MSVRKTSVRLGVVAAATSGLILSALGPALADTKPGSGGVAGTYTLGTTVIGVGSDTIQWVDDKLSADYDNQGTTPSPAWANFDACVGKDVGGTGANPDGSGFPCGADNTGTQAGVHRDEGVVDATAAGGPLPSGSGDGRNLLINVNDKLFNDVAYARSSGPLNTAGLNAGLIGLPFAVDKIVVATHPGGPAPASLTGPQLLGIYNGTYTNWNQVGGSNGAIHPYMPKNGSSTLNAFLSFLAALDGQSEDPGQDNDKPSHAAARQTWQGPGVTITDANWNALSATTNVEEHDPSVLIADPNGIEPFSYGRAQLANKNSSSVRIEGGWSADRELYHVVRGQKIPNAGNPAGDGTPFLYGSDSNVLENLFSKSGWVCTNATAQQDISDAGFWPLHTGTSIGSCGVPNQATQDSINASQSNGVNEGAATATNVSYASRTVHVTVASIGGGIPTGSVQVVISDPVPVGLPATSAASFHTTVALGADGTASIPVPASVSGSKVIDVAYLPTSFGANGASGHTALGSSYAQKVQSIPAVKKAATTVKASAKPSVLANSTKSSKVTVVVAAKAGTAHPAGTVKIMLGRKVIATGRLKASTGRTSRVVITVKGGMLKKGKNKLVVTYVPKGSFTAPRTAPSITITRTR